MVKKQIGNLKVKSGKNCLIFSFYQNLPFDYTLLIIFVTSLVTSLTLLNFFDQNTRKVKLRNST